MTAGDQATWRTVTQRLSLGVRDLYPGYFALVMATGIVSLGAFYLNAGPAVFLLFEISIVAYAFLWLLTLVRVVRFWHFVAADLTHHARGPAFMTMVAATCILGSQFVLIAQDIFVGMALWVAGAVLWGAQMYTFLAAVVVREPKPSIETGLNGGWLVIVVATQSVSLLGTILATRISPPSPILLFVMLALFLIGCMLYLLIIGLIFYRLVFFTLTPAEFRPPYWINMGAIAVTTLAGSTLALASPHFDLIQEIRPFLVGFTLFFWSAATWWIPLLIILELWRYFDRRYPVRYDPRDWDIVFPLGMYTVCTFLLAQLTGLPFLETVSRLFGYVAIASWVIVFLGMWANIIAQFGRIPGTSDASRRQT